MRTCISLPGLVLLAGCAREASNPAPPRVTAPAAIPTQSSAIAVPIAARLVDLETLINAEVPRVLVTIDERKASCVKVPVVGRVGCRLTGEVTRGRIRVAGDGGMLVLTIPVDAIVRARDIAHLIKSETATASAEIEARVQLSSIRNWEPRAKAELTYRWLRKPGVDFLGKRITFARQADPELARLLARLEATLPRQIDRLQPRERLEQVWALGFTAVKLNDRNPPVWLRVTPQLLRFRRYSIQGNVLTLDLAATAKTETFVGDRPPDPPVTPLPPPAPHDPAPDDGFRFHVPVIADYALLEPVLERALHKLEARPVELPGIGAVVPKFGKVTLYPTTNGRIAIGIRLRVDTPRRLIDPRGTVWLTGQPYNAPGSQRVRVRDLTVTGRPDSESFGVLLAVARSEPVRAELAEALSQDFDRDYARILAAAGRAIAEKRLGDFILQARVDNVTNGVIYPAGQGLYMPVDAAGTAELRYAPRKKGE